MTKEEIEKIPVQVEKELTFNEKMVRMQSELKAPKGQFNSFGKYKYRSCEDIVESVKPILAKYDLVLLLTDDLVVAGDRFYIKATAIIKGDGECQKVTAFAREPQELKGMSDSQITGTASSYARKYALNGLLAIDDTKDPDTDEFTNQTKKISSNLLDQCADLGIDLEKVATYFKKSKAELTDGDLMKAIAQKKKALSNGK